MSRVLKTQVLLLADWQALPQKGIINLTPFVILVARGNPKGIQDFPDLAKPGVRVIHPDPVSSGGAQWSILAIYGSELIKSQKESRGGRFSTSVTNVAGDLAQREVDARFGA